MWRGTMSQNLGGLPLLVNYFLGETLSCTRVAILARHSCRETLAAFLISRCVTKVQGIPVMPRWWWWWWWWGMSIRVFAPVPATCARSVSVMLKQTMRHASETWSDTRNINVDATLKRRDTSLVSCNEEETNVNTVIMLCSCQKQSVSSRFEGFL